VQRPSRADRRRRRVDPVVDCGFSTHRTPPWS
jgi:hypothetical protein